MHPALDPLQHVRAATAAVVAASPHVAVDTAACARLAAALDGAGKPPGWDASVHYSGAPDDVVQYLLVLDALNFCFWPDEGLGYADLAEGLRDGLRADSAALDAGRLAEATPATVSAWFGRPVCLADERARLVREVGAALDASFGGRAARLVAAADGSAARLVALVTAHVPGFRDAAVAEGRIVPLLKRAQIFAADVWGALGGAGLGTMRDVAALTTFADYRVPQILRDAGALRYAPGLAADVDALRPIGAGSAEEVAIRAATVQAVEAVRAALPGRGRAPTSVEVDWWLWHAAEARADAMAPHHRTLTVAY